MKYLLIPVIILVAGCYPAYHTGYNCNNNNYLGQQNEIVTEMRRQSYNNEMNNAGFKLSDMTPHEPVQLNY